jgi:hypothetical protein
VEKSLCGWFVKFIFRIRPQFARSLPSLGIECGDLLIGEPRKKAATGELALARCRQSAFLGHWWAKHGLRELRIENETIPGELTARRSREPHREGVMTKLEAYLKAKGIKPAHVALHSEYSRQHLLRVRMGRMADPEMHSGDSSSLPPPCLRGREGLGPLRPGMIMSRRFNNYRPTFICLCLH